MLSYTNAGTTTREFCRVVLIKAKVGGTHFINTEIGRVIKSRKLGFTFRPFTKTASSADLCQRLDLTEELSSNNLYTLNQRLQCHIAERAIQCSSFS